MTIKNVQVRHGSLFNLRVQFNLLVTVSMCSSVEDLKVVPMIKIGTCVINGLSLRDIMGTYSMHALYCDINAL